MEFVRQVQQPRNRRAPPKVEARRDVALTVTHTKQRKQSTYYMLNLARILLLTNIGTNTICPTWAMLLLITMSVKRPDGANRTT